MEDSAAGIIEEMPAELSKKPDALCLMTQITTSLLEGSEDLISVHSAFLVACIRLQLQFQGI